MITKNQVLYATATISPLILHYASSIIYKLMVAIHKDVYNKNGKFIFTSPENEKCRKHIYKQEICGDKCAYQHLLTLVSFINSAKSSVSLCACLITFHELQDALVKVKARGVNVKFFTDTEMHKNKASRITYLKEHGILIKTQKSPTRILHHKFCLIDAECPEPKLFFGSANLTCQAFVANWEYVVFIQAVNLIRRFNEEFEYLWSCSSD